jgi:hypothetical protein
MADVKFSELASLAAADVASADVLAIVDTDASTSKKLSIDNLFGSIPVNVLQTDATDATSSAGAVRTAGGVSMAKKLWVGTTSTLTGAVTATAGVFPAAQDGAALGSSSLQFSDLFLADGAVVAFGDDGEVTLTHTPDVGLTLSDASGVGVTKLMFGDAATFIQQSTDGQLDIDGDVEVEITGPIVDINASTSVNISNDLKLDSDACVLGFGDGNDVTLTHYADNGLVLNGTRKIYFEDGSNYDQYIASAGSGVTAIAAPAEIDLTATAIDINGTVDMSGLVTVQTGIVPNAQDGAYLGTSSLQFSDLFLADEAVIAFGDDGEVTLTHVQDSGLILSDASGVGVTKLMFGDAATYIHQSADSHLDVVADGDITLAATDIKVGLASQDANIQALTDVFDMTFKQYDGFEVARITDGAKAVPTGFAAVQTAKGGFGYRRMVISHTQANTTTSTLTLAESGAIIQLIGSGTGFADLITLPAITAVDVGAFFDFVVTTVFHGSDTCKILCETAAAAGSQGFCLDAFNAAGGSGDEHTRTAFSAGATDFLTIPASTPVGTTVHVEAVVGGSGTMWMATSYTTGVTVAASST